MLSEKTLKALERYGIHNEEELVKAYEEQEKIDISIFTQTCKKEQTM